MVKDSLKYIRERLKLGSHTIEIFYYTLVNMPSS